MQRSQHQSDVQDKEQKFVSMSNIRTLLISSEHVNEGYGQGEDSLQAEILPPPPKG